VPVGLGAFCASGAKRQHKMGQRKYQVEAVVSHFLCTHQGHRLQNLKDIVYTLPYAFP